MYYVLFKKILTKVTTTTRHKNPHKWGFLSHYIPFNRDRSKKLGIIYEIKKVRHKSH